MDIVEFQYLEILLRTMNDWTRKQCEDSKDGMNLVYTIQTIQI